MKSFFRILICLFIFMCIGIPGFTRLAIAQNNNDDKTPVHEFKSNTFVQEWLVLGPLPNPLADEPMQNGSLQTGFYKDYLLSIGGESKARLNEDTEIIFEDENGLKQSIHPQLVKSGKKGVIDLEKHFGKVDHKATYAFCYIHSDVDQDAVFLFGSDDGTKVWINGSLVHNIDVGRGLRAREDIFRAKLKRGLNPVLVKISEWVREWAFVMETFDNDGYAEIEAQKKYMADFDEFLKTSLEPKDANTWNYVFGPGDLPELEWEKPYLVEKIFGEINLNVRWFDNQLNEVKKAENPGRYAYSAEGMTPDGIKIRRAGTLFCMPSDWMAWAERPRADLKYIPLNIFDKKIWQARQEAIADFAGRIVLLSMLDQKEGAVLLSYLDEMKAAEKNTRLTDTPIIRDHDYHLALKRKILGVENKWPILKLPQKISGLSSNIIRDGNEDEAGIKKDTAEKIRSVCQEWYQESGEPFNILIARHGVIIINEAFGENPNGKETTETVTEIASTTKLLTGMMFAQFVDQGLISIDDPVGKYLPDFPISGDKALTLRHCFTHTGGLWGHEEWGGVHDPWMDNKIASILPELFLGERYEYNGVGYNLAGKVMEMVSGKSIFRLMREHFFDPLKLQNTILEEDLAFGCHTNARELAVIAQLLLNKGSYGDLRFFSPQTYEKLLPKQLNEFYPGVNVEQGIGITWMRQAHPEAGKNGTHADQTILSKNIIGHGSATSAVFRVDPDNDLVICQTRRRGGKYYEKYLEKLLMAIEQGLVD